MENLEIEPCTERCNTRSGYQQHLYKKEAPCPSSRRARLAWAKEYRETNAEVYKAGQKSYYEKNKRTFYLRNKEYREANPDHVREYHREWSRNNPDNSAQSARKRRALKRNNGHNPYTTSQVLDLYGSVCHVCLKEIDLTAPKRVGLEGWENGLHVDHLIPLSKGGPDSIENVRPAHGSCNLKKRNVLETK